MLLVSSLSCVKKVGVTMGCHVGVCCGVLRALKFAVVQNLWRRRFEKPAVPKPFRAPSNFQVP